MKQFILIGILTMFCTGMLFAQQQSLNARQAEPVCTLISSDETETVVLFQFANPVFRDVNTSQGVKQLVSMPGTSPVQTKGEPAVLKYARSLIIPDHAHMSVEVLSVEYEEYAGMELAPSKGNIYRDIDPASVPWEWGRTYSENGVFPSVNVTLSEPYIVRDFRGATINIFPVQYDHANRTVKAIKSIKVRVYQSGVSNVNAFNRNASAVRVQEDFDQLYAKHFVNYQRSKYSAVSERGNILVISYGSYMNAMAPWVQWKKRIGFPTTIVDVATIGTTATAIKTYVTNYYNTNGLTYLLLVGDGQHIPPVTSGVNGPSDNAYAYVSGSDHYPDFYVGRFSAESTADVDVQVLRTITYEQNPSTTNNWMNRVMGIASSQGPGDDNEYDYVHIRNLQTQCTNYEYLTKYEIFDGSQGGLDASGDPSASNVSNVLNGDGAGLILYTGHGSDQSFVTTGFDNSDVNALTNTTRWPFIFAVACVNGNFQGQTCFAEAWLRARTGTTPKGAVATIMSTINQSWNPPMEGQDEMVNVLTENNASNIKHSFGGIVMSGCMKMNDTYNTDTDGTGYSDGVDMTDTWTIFGDPSLMIRTDTPNVMSVTHAANVPVGSTSLVVNSNAEGAFITVTLNDNILGTGIITAGTTSISFSALAGVDTLLVTATKYNYIPYMGEVPVIAATGPYIVYSTATINDAAGNGNGLADYNESVLLNLTLENMGVANANNVTATISTSDPAVTVTDNSEVFGAINAGSSKTMNDAYAMTISNSVADQHSILFDVNAVDASGNWSSSFSVVLQAPALSIGNLSIDDAAGNGNGRLDPGETVNVSIESSNNGHATYVSANGGLASGSSYATMISGVVSLGDLDPAETQNPVYSFSVDAATPAGASVSLIYTIGSGYYAVSDTFTLRVGIADEDYESGDFTQYSWVNSGNQPWTVSTENPFEGTYCSKSGTISDNQSSTMSLTWEVAAPDSITFYRKVDCEEGSASGSKWDYLQFKIGGVEKDWWDGTKGWERVSYPVAAGSQTFTWSYVKDGYVSEGADAAWVDYIVFPPLATPAGIDHLNGNAFRIYPNPAFDGFYIETNLTEAGMVRIEYLQPDGKLVEVLFEGNLPAGSSTIKVEPRFYCSSCFVRLINDYGSVSRMIWMSR